MIRLTNVGVFEELFASAIDTFGFGDADFDDVGFCMELKTNQTKKQRRETNPSK